MVNIVCPASSAFRLKNQYYKAHQEGQEQVIGQMLVEINFHKRIKDNPKIHVIKNTLEVGRIMLFLHQNYS